MRVERLRLAGRLALTLEDSWVPSGRFPGIEDLDLRGSIYALMRDLYGHVPVRVVETLEPVVAQRHSAELLGVAAGSPLMLVERTAFDADGVAVEFAHDLHRGDRARFVVEAAAPLPGQLIRPRRSAIATAWTRLCAASLCIACSA